MTVKDRFRIERLPRALTKDLREREPHFKRAQTKPSRYWRATYSSGLVLFVLYEDQLTRGLMSRRGEGVGFLCEYGRCDPVSRELDAALKLNDLDQQRNWDRLKHIAKQVAAGYWNSGIVERLRQICEDHRLHESESILASTPPRDQYGPVHVWISNAISQFLQARCACLFDRRELIRQAEGDE